MAAEQPGTAAGSADDALVAAARAGDRDAFSRLVDRYRDVVFAYAFAYLHSREEAEDLAQEVFARAYLSLCDLRGSTAWKPWLMRILRNRCCDAVRRRKVRKTEPLDVGWLAADGSPEALVLDEELRRELDAAVAALPESLRVPLLMHFVSRCTYREIAAALGLPETTVVGRTSRAIRTLRARLQELDL